MPPRTPPPPSRLQRFKPFGWSAVVVVGIVGLEVASDYRHRVSMDPHPPCIPGFVVLQSCQNIASPVWMALKPNLFTVNRRQETAPKGCVRVSTTYGLTAYFRGTTDYVLEFQRWAFEHPQMCPP